MMRAGRWRRPEDRKAARFRLTTSPGGGVVCLRNGARGGGRFAASLTLGHTLEGDVEGRTLLFTLADACKASDGGVPVRAAEGNG
jgi:hypothetical protein